jgi:hypothetical protein
VTQAYRLQPKESLKWREIKSFCSSTYRGLWQIHSTNSRIRQGCRTYICHSNKQHLQTLSFHKLNSGYLSEKGKMTAEERAEPLWGKFTAIQGYTHIHSLTVFFNPVSAFSGKENEVLNVFCQRSMSSPSKGCFLTPCLVFSNLT